MVAGRAELFVQHDLVDTVGGLLLILADQNALAQRQAIRFDNDRVLALGLDVVHDLFRIVERLIFRCRNAVFFHQVFAEHLAGLNAGRSLVGAESRDADSSQCIDHAQGQRVILGDDYIIEGFFFRKLDHRVHIGGRDGLAGGIVADAAVAGCAPDLSAAGAFFQRTDDGVLTPAAANDQNFHEEPPVKHQLPATQNTPQAR